MREHRNRPLIELGAPALAILVTALRRAGLEHDDAAVAQLLGFDGPPGREQASGGADESSTTPRRREVTVAERPPIVTIPEYQGRRLTIT